MTHFSLFLLLPLTLIACGDKDDTTDTAAETTETTEDAAGCVAGDMAGDWSGYAFGNETIAHTINLDDSAEVGEKLGSEYLDASYYGEGFGCTFDLVCMAGFDAQTLILDNILDEENPAGSCTGGIYHLSLYAADELLVQFFEYDSDEVFAEGVLTR